MTTRTVPRLGMLVAPAIAAIVLAAALAGPVYGAEFDRTLPATRGSRLDVQIFGGEVVVRGWNRDEVRIQATHFQTDEIEARAGGDRISVRARARRGQPHGIDFDIHVPAWMPVVIAGTYVDITVEGTRAAVSAQTVRGDVTVRGGADALLLKSVEGEVTLEDSRGRADISAVNNGIRVSRFEGNVTGETVNGSIKLTSVAASSVNVSTIGGDIRWAGPMTAGGRYELATHDGDVDVDIGGSASVTVTARAFHGVIRSTLPVPLPASAAAGKKTSFTIGSGAAQLVLETFSGTISLR